MSMTISLVVTHVHLMDHLLMVNGVTAHLWGGDCLERLKTMKSDSIDLVMTSPPYANQRRATYGGIPANRYVDWFCPYAQELQRVLKPTGTWILNIKEHVVEGQRHPYVLHLILALREQGWLWTEEYIWHKKNAMPGKWPNRFRDAWERLLQFNRQRHFAMYQDTVMVPISTRTQAKLKQLRPQDFRVVYSGTGSGFNKRTANWLGRQKAYPTNVLYLAVESHNYGHSAVFPKTLPSWFIQLFTKPGDTILDPFMGSGTTCVTAVEHGRHAIGIDLIEEYLEIASNRIRALVHEPMHLPKSEIRSK